MEVNEDLILKLERLTKLSIIGEERESLKQDLQKIIEMFGKIADVDTEGIEPLRNLNGYDSPLREDAVNQEIDTHQILEQSKHIYDNHYTIPKVISK